MLNRTYFMERPEERRIVVLPDGCADVWIRRNIVEVTDEETGEVHFEADEAYMRLPEGIDPEEVTFEEAAKYKPASEKHPPRLNGEARIAALESENAALDERLTDTQLALCELYELLG